MTNGSVLELGVPDSIPICSCHGGMPLGTFPSLKLVCLPMDHEQVNCHHDIDEIMFKTIDCIKNPNKKI